MGGNYVINRRISHTRLGTTDPLPEKTAKRPLKSYYYVRLLLGGDSRNELTDLADRAIQNHADLRQDDGPLLDLLDIPRHAPRSIDCAVTGQLLRLQGPVISMTKTIIERVIIVFSHSWGVIYMVN